MSTYWNAVQACVWIATRDERLVARVRNTDTLFVTDETISNGSLYDASHHVVMEETLDGKPTSPTVLESRKSLAEACANGTLVMLGRARGEGDQVEMPATAWANLEMRDHDKFGFIAASPDMFDATATWWDELRVPARTVQRHWPFPRRRHGVEIWQWDSRPDTVAEAAWAERRRRMFRHQQPTALALVADGLPDEHEISLVEALSWCAFGRALPPFFWTADLDVKQADETYASARTSCAHGLRSFLRAKAAKEAGEAEGQVTDSQRRDYRVAVMVANDAREAEQAAREKLASALSHWLLLGSVYQAARQQRNVPASDRGFEQRTADEAEKGLLKAFLTGELECLGRRSDDVPAFEVLPKDCFRFPVKIQLHHNILEPSGKGSMEDHRVVMAHVATWRDLRVNVAALRSWWNSKRPADAMNAAGSHLQSASAVKPHRRGGNPSIVDIKHLERYAEAKKASPALTIRSFVLEHDQEIEGANVHAKIRRLQLKLKDSQVS